MSCEQLNLLSTYGAIVIFTQDNANMSCFGG